MRHHRPSRAVARGCLVLALCGFGPLAVHAQAPAATTADVATIDAIMHAVYDVISGPQGEVRDWDRFRSLFLPEARLVATGRGPNGVSYRPMSPDDYIQANGQGLTDVGFRESEISRTVEQFGNIAHAFSTYESKFTRQGQAVTQRGINSVQLYNDGKRWWVLTIFWDSERPDNPIPPKYLGRGS